MKNIEKKKDSHILLMDLEKLMIEFLDIYDHGFNKRKVVMVIILTWSHDMYDRVFRLIGVNDYDIKGPP